VGEQGSAGGLDRYLTGWEPAPRHEQDLLGEAPAAALAAVLDDPGYHPGAGDPLPPLWHWMFFLEWPAHRQLGVDGHPREGRFLPPVPDRRRMFAGGRVRLARPLRLGQPAERRSELAGCEVKHGRSGELLLTSVRYEIWQAGELAVIDEQDLVYRSGQQNTQAPVAAQADAAQPASSAAWQSPLVADPVLLFRFSALTANAHRIHYDERYTREVERYPGLVVHGPLLLLRMLELVRRNCPDRAVSSVNYRLRRPVFAGEPLLVTGVPNGDTVELAVLGPGEEVRASAQVELG
jgi:hydroxyacyl-ACP dehydratase HTD2-like protein with hotdog domain